MLKYLAASLCALVACTDAPSDALHFDVRGADHVAGTFSHDGVAIGFDIARRADHHVIALTAADGSPLVTTTTEGAVQTTDVLGGKLVMSGIPNMPSPTITGDRAALAELDARPEAAALELLGDELRASDVPQALLAPETTPVAGYGEADPIYGGYAILYNQQHTVFLSKPFDLPTYIYLKKMYNTQWQAQVWIAPWSSATSFFLTANTWGREESAMRRWWGAAFEVWCVSPNNTCMVRINR
ncbi:MAG: hypothetical protein KIT31_03195 [Deltaproteobacteria bacterium]|nr:hypothetical protein [Deltaproteobacteria bacterium]